MLLSEQQAFSGQPRKGMVDFGHKAGKGYDNMFQNYKSGKISLEQLKNFQSNPKNFRIEEFSANRSRMFEKTIWGITEGFPWLSSLSNVVKEYIYEN